MTSSPVVAERVEPGSDWLQIGGLLNSGATDAAIDALVDAVTAESRPLVDVAQDLRRQGRDEAAVQVLIGAALLDRGRLRDAIEVLFDLPQPPKTHPAVRAALGGAYYRLGLMALAVDAYDHPRRLRREDRLDRRRAWWQSGGPLRFLRHRRMRADRDAFKRAGTGPAAADDLSLLAGPFVEEGRRTRVALEQVDQLLEEGRSAEATVVLTSAGSANVALLLARERVERAREDYDAALAHLDAAVAHDPGDLRAVCRRAWLLSVLYRDRDALAVLTALSPPADGDPLVRATRGQIYASIEALLTLPWVGSARRE